MKLICLLVIIQSLLYSTNAIEVIPQRNPSQMRFAFGSCNKFTQNMESEIFSKIAKQEADAFAWLGDATYIDIREFVHFWQPDPDPVSIARKFDNAKLDKYYQEFLSSGSKVVGIWDDHDYNNNDGGKEFQGKQIIQQLYLDFLDEPANSQRRKSTSGIYTSYYIGDQKRVKLILLDVRFMKEDKNKVENPDMLGEEQWKWLDNELRDKEVILFLIASGTQVIPDDRLLQETWYDGSRRRLLSVIKEASARVLLLSGDIHQAEIMTMPCSEQYLGYPLLEVTSSGLSFSNLELDSLFPFFKEFVPLGVPQTFSNHDTDRYLHRNYGMIIIDWNEDNLPESIIQLNIYGNKTIAQPVLSRQMPINKFYLDPSNIKETITCPIYEKTGRQRLAANFVNLVQQMYPPAIIATAVAALITMNIFKFAKGILGLCFGQANKKIKQD